MQAAHWTADKDKALCNKHFRSSEVTQEWEVLLGREGKEEWLLFLLHPSQSKICQQKAQATRKTRKQR